MSLDDITKTPTSRAQRRRVGRGIGSGLGKTCGRGQKGEGTRTGGKNRGPLFEGGQFPFWMRLPKRGFTNFAHRETYLPLDLEAAMHLVSGDELSLAKLVAAKAVRPGVQVKLVNGGAVKLKRKLTVTMPVTGSVRKVVEAAGGTVQWVKPISKSARKPETKTD
ncbi:50S ribosomal protein L15 [Candidatus Dependentiae bacterium]|nr:50S ribosomal protein L15 [Candidatus Dependentiae bacterium]